jgi:hypothetical protein
VTETQAGDRPALINRLETLVGRPATTNGDGGLPVGPVVAASLTGLRAELTEMEERLAAIEDTVDALSDRLESRIASLDDRLAALMQSMSAERSAASQHREKTSEALQEQAGALDEWAEAVRAGLEDLGEAVATSLGNLGETLQDPASRDADRRHIEALVTEVMTAIDESTRPIDQQLASLQGGILDGFADSRERLLEELGGVLEALERASVETRDNVELQLTELRNDFADALDEVREHVDETVGGSSVSVTNALDELRSDWTSRAEVVVSEGRAAAEGVLADVQATLAEQAEAIGTVTGTIGGGTERLVAAGQALLAYLADRDRALERERDRVLQDVLEEFAVGLTARERRAVASRVGEAVDRHRDSRDAARFRRSQAGEPELDIPSVPGVMARLSEPIPTPPRPVARRSGLRPAPSPAASSTRKPAAKSTAGPDAKQAAKKPTKTASKTPAKSSAKPPAKKAPAAKKAAPTRKKRTSAPARTSADAPATEASPSGANLPSEES